VILSQVEISFNPLQEFIMAKKAASKKSASKKAPAKKAPAKKAPAKKANKAPGRSRVISRVKELGTGKAATKSEMVTAVAESSGVSRAHVKSVLEATKSFVSKELCTKGVARIADIAMLRAKVRPAKKNAIVRNPRTGETIRRNLPKKITVRARALGEAKKAGSCPR
jgi:nucleoid DNA-binding protein